MSLNLGFKEHLKALTGVTASGAAPHWWASLHCMWFSWKLLEPGEGENAQSHSSHVSEWKHTSGTWYTCFSWNEAVVFHWAVITTTHATEIIKWREGNTCALTELLIVLIPFLEWPEQNQNDIFRFLDFFFPKIAIIELALQSKHGI